MIDFGPMPQKRWIGVDPGKTGAVALLLPDIAPHVQDLEESLLPAGFTLPLQRVERVDLFPRYQAVVELPDARPGKGVRDFVFNAGRIAGALETHGCALHLVPAAVWKGRMGLIRSKKSKSLELARELFPELAHRLTRQKDHGRAEALLIAEYGRRYLV